MTRLLRFAPLAVVLACAAATPPPTPKAQVDDRKMSTVYVYAQAGAGPYSAWGIGCLSADRGCEQGIRTLGLQGSVGAGTRFAIGGRTWIAGLRAVTLERATGRRGVVTLLQLGSAF